MISGIKKKKSKGEKLVGNVFKTIAFLSANFFRWLIWAILGILSVLKINFFNYLFLVYPGTDSDVYGYCKPEWLANWLAKSPLFSKRPAIAGIISRNCAGRGLIFVVPNTSEQFRSDKDVCNKIMKRLNRIRKLIGAKAIAIAGQAPGMIIRNGIPLNEPFVQGNKGTVFCVMETIDQAAKKHGLDPLTASIVIVGVGYSGGLLLKGLRDKGCNAIGVDIEMKDNGIVALKEDGCVFLPLSDIVVVLTPKGSDFAPYVKYLKKGAIVIDDTHPKITDKPPNVHFYKVAVGIGDTIFYPRLPGYHEDWIPGCAVEAIISTATGKFNNTSQSVFNKEAKKLGFYAHLVS